MVKTDAVRIRKTLIEYLYAKAQMRDWHGVSDAANDLRELEARYPFLKEKDTL